MRTRAERGPYGRWLVDARLARQMNTTDAARQALADAGIVIAKSVYAQYEAGSKQPSRNHLPMLEAFWGPFADPDASGPPDVLLTALGRQSDAMNRIAEEIKGLRDALVPVSRRAADAERRDSEWAGDRGREADDEPPAAPGRRPA